MDLKQVKKEVRIAIKHARSEYIHLNNVATNIKNVLIREFLENIKEGNLNEITKLKIAKEILKLYEFHWI